MAEIWIDMDELLHRDRLSAGKTQSYRSQSETLAVCYASGVLSCLAGVIQREAASAAQRTPDSSGQPRKEQAQEQKNKN
ncbi:jg7696 [Pararge aegeria aegeria]|uniref:Jg7696 protein n=1 Tax=Pararge aegeria aegeria TaxID=348720 RepID=A0A8S4RXH2_9NEOP|nr:jg7696 [Pararge aegeria aegeria]